MSRGVLTAFLVVTEFSRVGAPPLQVFAGARLAERAVLHRDVSAVVLEVQHSHGLGPAALLLCPGRSTPEQCPGLWWCPFPKVSLMDSGGLFKVPGQAAAAGLSNSAALRNPTWQWDEQTQGLTPLLIILINEPARWRT